MMPELLAPAGSVDGLKAAVENGADAVYLGLEGIFNARLKASGFTVHNLTEWVEYAHLHGVRVYLTLNTAIKEDELKESIEVAKVGKIAKVDAIIVSDIGLIHSLRSTMPDIDLHLSTQAGIHNMEGALEAVKLGVRRIILSREARMGDIIKIKKNIRCEIEVFVHGALCVSFSGNCLLSSFIGGNSGNRGLCKQPCRQHYKAILDTKICNTGYLLSTSDLCMLPCLNKLTEIGVDSLKIEGRLRRAEYTAQVVRTYRRVLNANGLYTEQDISDLKKIYNRGDFTNGYYFMTGTKKDDLISSAVQGHKGLFVGHVSSVLCDKYNESTLLLTGKNVSIVNGNAYKVLRNGKEIGNAVVKNGHVKGTSGIKKGDELYITSDEEQLQTLKVQNKKLPVKIRFIANIGERAQLVFIHNEHTVYVSSEFIVPPAHSVPTAKSEIKIQMLKLNTTPFVSDEIEIKTMGDLFIAKSQLNKMRREAVEKLKTKILSAYYDR
jgi:putative protease